MWYAANTSGLIPDNTRRLLVAIVYDGDSSGRVAVEQGLLGYRERQDSHILLAPEEDPAQCPDAPVWSSPP
ncbi:hypothetical protein MAP00_004939 [Monascus purpureus]|nr:hypothetical protein MAP00_004939 [Monascus purpureus]